MIRVFMRSTRHARPPPSKRARRFRLGCWRLPVTRRSRRAAAGRMWNWMRRLHRGWPDPSDDPEVVLQKKTRAELVRHSLAGLSPEHGEVIDLVYFHGKSRIHDDKDVQERIVRRSKLDG